MRKYSLILIVSFVMTVILAGCGEGRSSQSSHYDDCDTIPLRYASNLTLTQHDGYIVARVRNPWDTAKTLQTYILVPRDSAMPKDLPEGKVVRTPVSNALVYSTVHYSMVKELGRRDAIGGVCDPQYIKDPELPERIASGKVADCGNSMSPDIEKILKLMPDVIMLSPFENDDSYAKVEKLGIPVIECADYMETSALARTEWIRFYGRLLGRGETADSLFAATEGNYLRLKDMAGRMKTRPKVILDQRYGQVWNVPGGKSTAAGVIRDAGGANPFDHYSQSGSVPLAPERVLSEAHDADVWFVRYNQEKEKTLKELAGDAAVNSQFKAYKDGNVYGCNTRYVNFYEEIPFHPDRWLGEMIRRIHPELADSIPSSGYYTPMK